jgi:N-acetylglutamate synthase-like GNAT family acetyltransferase
MIINLFGYLIKLQLPLRLILSAQERIMFLTSKNFSTHIDLPTGYEEKSFCNSDYPALLELYRKCGFQFNLKSLRQAIVLCIPDGVNLIVTKTDGKIVAVMMARHLPFFDTVSCGRIDWLAVDPCVRGIGLGRLAATMATNSLLRAGYATIWVTTQSKRSDALKIFEAIGFTQRTQDFL